MTHESIIKSCYCLPAIIFCLIQFTSSYQEPEMLRIIIKVIYYNISNVTKQFRTSRNASKSSMNRVFLTYKRMHIFANISLEHNKRVLSFFHTWAYKLYKSCLQGADRYNRSSKKKYFQPLHLHIKDCYANSFKCIIFNCNSSYKGKSVLRVKFLELVQKYILLLS